MDEEKLDSKIEKFVMEYIKGSKFFKEYGPESAAIAAGFSPRVAEKYSRILLARKNVLMR